MGVGVVGMGEGGGGLRRGLRNADLKRGLLLVYANLVQVNYIVMRHFFIHFFSLNLKVGVLELGSGLLSSLQRTSTIK